MATIGLNEIHESRTWLAFLDSWVLTDGALFIASVINLSLSGVVPNELAKIPGKATEHT